MARSETNPTAIPEPNAGESKGLASVPTNVPTDLAATGVDGFAEQPVAKSTEKGPFLVGRSDVGTHREITRRDFKSVGIDQETLLFDWRKDFKIPVKNINPEAVKFLTENEYGFSVVDE